MKIIPTFRHSELDVGFLFYFGLVCILSMRQFSKSDTARIRGSIAFSISAELLPYRVTSLRGSFGPQLWPFCSNMSKIDRLKVENLPEHRGENDVLGMLGLVLDPFR